MSSLHLTVKSLSLRFSGIWKLIDFGSARRVGDTNEILFTAGWGAPEIQRDGKAIDVVVNESIDMWALGKIIDALFRA